MEPFVGKVALVTGGGSGIGRATSLAFAKKGAKVVIAGRTREKIVETQEMIKNLGGEAIAVQADVSAEEQVREMIQTTIDLWSYQLCMQRCGDRRKTGSYGRCHRGRF
ncbi:SDR family NAD(P)-dependent oxidoreductase [Thermoactinomyces sp. CICC 10523]|jgi:NAD(P)-dependent dehydrogenase (short-subunit alcohol dehydrogenase family)|nr:MULTISPECIES: SDR family NAD(P)-dependent oxidoreductase [Thermoactinomyces]MBH8599170.1 SDR family NAD(P)-dependent oxidoreductase [Thermoactinomyces sp. CICC 10523]